jgi:transposase-like protein
MTKRQRRSFSAEFKAEAKRPYTGWRSKTALTQFNS